ncbi:MAG TPA: hypothetical protein VE338_01825 [Ktedonobacterales bacterium]|jgi:hypothetical protein|nr:hypothetical protein [Ktedonobacterales bacterium]
MANQVSPPGQSPQDRGLVSHIGPVRVDWPRSLGYYGGIGIALAAGIIDPPLAIFIGAIPFLKMLNRPRAPLPVRFVGQVLDGAAKPVGGSSEATIELDSARDRAQPTARPTMWQEARQIANRVHPGASPS